jgi:uncharacterized delta-60 repeat protein
VAARAYRRSPIVALAKPNAVHELQANFPNDALLGEQWALNNAGQQVDGAFGQPDADIDATEAWDRRTGAPVTVGVLDSGIDLTHADVESNLWANPREVGGGAGVDDDGNGFVDDTTGWNFVAESNDPDDDVGHGTYMASTIGASGNDGNLIAGVNWNVRLAALKVCTVTGCDEADIIEGIAYAAAEGMKVVNMSLGGEGFSTLLEQAIEAAPSTLFVTAAGNGADDAVGDDNDGPLPEYPCSFDSPNILCVAATDSRDRLATFSNYGATTVDLAAPGVNIIGHWKDGSMGIGDGTSPATAFVSGAAALLLGESPSASVASLRSSLMNGVDEVDGLAGKVVTGGRLNVANSLPPFTAPVAGALDTDFDVDGKVATDAGDDEEANAVAMQASGKYVVAGRRGGAGTGDFVLTRYERDGSLDRDFGTNGRVVTDLGGDDDAQAIALYPTTHPTLKDRIVVAGTTTGGSLALAQYTIDGAPDNSFSGDGKLTSASMVDARAVAISNFTVLVGGRVETGGPAGSDFAVAKYTSNGNVDASWDGDGKAVTDFGPNDAVHALLDTAGGILAAGTNGSDFALARYQAFGGTPGSLDTTFDGDGKVTTDFGDTDSAHALDTEHNLGGQQVTGILAAGRSGSDFAVARYSSSGALSASFDGDGKVTTPFTGGGEAHAVWVQNDPLVSSRLTVLVAGRAGTGAGSEFALARYTQTGALDSAFGTAGKVTTSLGPNSDARGMVVDERGRVVVTGGTDVDIATAAYVNGRVTVRATPNTDLTLGGERVLVEGTGFKPNDTVQIQHCRGSPGAVCVGQQVEEAPNPTFPDQLPVDSQGSFSGHVTVDYTLDGFGTSCENPVCAIRTTSLSVNGQSVDTPISFEAVPSISTYASDGLISLGHSLTLGESFTQTAEITGQASHGNPTGTVRFFVCGPLGMAEPTCSGGTAMPGNPVTVTAGPTDANGNPTATATSGSYTPPATGRYCVRSEYTGDLKYEKASDSSRKGACVLVANAGDGFDVVDDVYTVAPGATLNVSAAGGVRQNDLATPGAALTYTQPAFGSVTVAQDGSLTYVAPATPQTDTFTYTLQQAGSDPETATVTVEVDPEVDVMLRRHLRRRHLRRRHLRRGGFRAIDSIQSFTVTDCRARALWINPQFTIMDDTGPVQIRVTASLYDSSGNRLASTKGPIVDGLFYGSPFHPTVVTWPTWSTPVRAGGSYVRVFMEVDGVAQPDSLAQCTT